jgi:hypothetical protein
MHSLPVGSRPYPFFRHRRQVASVLHPARSAAELAALNLLDDPLSTQKKRLG